MYTPHPLSHKGQNGKVMIIGGSDLFHAASQWSFKAISRWVDMTFYSSVAENNQLLHDAKLYGNDGVIVRRQDLLSYIEEVDSILIGPGMRRDIRSRFSEKELDQVLPQDLKNEDWESDTAAVTSALLRAFPQKQWVIDAGALQVLRPQWLPPHAVLTPHQGEFRQLLQHAHLPESLAEEVLALQSSLGTTSSEASLPAKLIEPFRAVPNVHLNGAVILLKGVVDLIWDATQVLGVQGGNAGMTKGGTGDVLAGLAAAFAAKTNPWESAVTASWLNKQAGHEVFQRQGLMYNATDLVEQLPRTWKERSYAVSSSSE